MVNEQQEQAGEGALGGGWGGGGGQTYGSCKA